MPLTDIAIKNAKPGQPPSKQKNPLNKSREAQNDAASSASSNELRKPKPYRLWDGGGLYIEVGPSGGKVVALEVSMPG
jgi:hypothetical protein